MKHRTLVLSAACLFSLAGMAMASEPARHSYECDTPAGHFSYWRRTIAGKTIDVEGKLTVNELRKDAKWTPTAFVVLQGGADEKTRFGIRLYTIPKAADTFFLEIVTPGGNEKLGLGLIPSTQEPIPFELHLDEKGQFRVDFAGLTSSASAGDFKPASIEFSCSTGDFEFRDFVIREPAGG
jgi:hypothetical protein